MDIKSIFRSKAGTLESLAKKHRDLSQQKKDLEKRADSLRAESLKSDADAGVSEQIKEIGEEISLSEVALSEVKKELQAKIEKKIQADYEKLPEQRLEFETKQADLTKQAGTQLGQAVQTLQATDLSFATTLGRFIREQIVDFSNDHRRRGQMTEFLIGYGGAISSQNGDGISFRDWKKRLAKVEGLRPESPEAKNHIAAKVKQLISA